MTSEQTTESPTALRHDPAALWSMPWHARLKNLAEGWRPGVAMSPGKPASAVHTWLQRVRTAS